jgi:hypothetical protein
MQGLRAWHMEYLHLCKKRKRVLVVIFTHFFVSPSKLLFLTFFFRRIPSSAQDGDVGGSIAPILGGPVKQCFPCSAVMTYPIHYPGTSRQINIDSSIAWRCPGGSSPPEQCANKQFVQSDNGASCICKTGYFAVNSTFCALCPKGYQCLKGTKEPCQKHYYQPSEGASQCLKCVESATDDGFYRCVQPGTLLKMCDPAVANTQDQPLSSQCLPCNQCKRAYATSTDANLFSCYRDR